MSEAEYLGTSQESSLQKKNPPPPSLAREAPGKSGISPRLELDCRLGLTSTETRAQAINTLLVEAADPDRALVTLEIEKHVSQARVSYAKF